MSKRLAAAYIAVLLALTLLPVFGYDPTDPVQLHLVPFRTIRTALHSGIVSREFVLLVGNVAIFMPLGVFIPLVTGRRSWLRVFGGALVLSGGIELTQLALSLVVGFNYRTADVDDVITNVTGALLGYALFLVYCFFWQRQGTAADR